MADMPTSTPYNLNVQNSSFNEEASKYISHVIRDWNRRQLTTVSIDKAIMNLSNDSLLLESVLRGIPEHNPIILPDYNCHDKENYNGTRKSDFFIVIAGNLSLVSKFYFILVVLHSFIEVR